MDCYHCGDKCDSRDINVDDHIFCCFGCKMVYELLNESSLEEYYSMESTPGTKVDKRLAREKYEYLDNEEIKQRFLLFKEGNVSKVSFALPQIHCSSCIW
ncbi:MAG: heavy metal translocating P-type ATPase metal-binding domain-containing protein, partial [Flavobacteriales bacterium]